MLSRRGFLGGVAAAAAGWPAGRTLLGFATPPMQSQSRGVGELGDLPAAELGLTGRRVARLGIGAFPLGNLSAVEDGVAVLMEAFRLGVRYVDTAPSYGNGESERRVGIALARWKDANDGLKRDEFFIATKTLRRDADGARKELDESLERLGLSYVDSVQCHEVHNDWESLFSKGGAIEGLEKARDDGTVRHIGITGHRDPKWLIESIRRYPFATALVPVNPIDVQHKSFVREFLPVALDRKVPVIGMKVFGGGFLLNLRDDEGKAAYTADDLLTYALAQDGVAVAVPGCDQLEHVRSAAASVAAYRKPDADFVRGLEAKAPRHTGKPTEWYKDDE